jgi:hypothetical protein
MIVRSFLISLGNLFLFFSAERAVARTGFGHNPFFFLFHVLEMLRFFLAETAVGTVSVAGTDKENYRS